MKKIILLLTLIFLLGSMAGCSIVLLPALYGPPYYTGPGYYPPLVVVAPAPVAIGPVIIAPSWEPYYYGYYGGYGYPYYRYRGGYYHHYR